MYLNWLFQNGSFLEPFLLDGVGCAWRPFIFERENQLIIRLRIGVTLRSPEQQTVGTQRKRAPGRILDVTGPSVKNWTLGSHIIENPKINEKWMRDNRPKIQYRSNAGQKWHVFDRFVAICRAIRRCHIKFAQVRAVAPLQIPWCGIFPKAPSVNHHFSDRSLFNVLVGVNDVANTWLKSPAIAMATILGGAISLKIT